MMIPTYTRFYGYTVAETLNEYARTFFTMVNAMNRLKGREMLDGIVTVSTGVNGDKDKKVLPELEKQSKGLHGILQEVRVIKP